jgi:hypothetical protein
MTAFEGVKELNFNIVGEPTTVTEARALANQDAYQFQWWALSLVKARPAEHKKGSDRGIDGRNYFFESSDDRFPKQIIISVKSGENIGVKDIRDLRGVIEREKAPIGVLITLCEPTKSMITEAVSASFYMPSKLANIGIKYPRIQILTIGELFQGKQVLYPIFIPTDKSLAFKPAPKAKKEKSPKQKYLGE